MVAVKCVECALRGTNQPIIRYSVNIVPVENVSSYKYIGADIALKLSWSTLIQYVIDNDNCMLVYIRCNHSPRCGHMPLYYPLLV